MAEKNQVKYTNTERYMCEQENQLLVFQVKK